MDTITLTNAQGRSVSVEYDWEQGRLAGCNVFDSSGAPIFARTQTRASRRPALVTACASGGTGPAADTRSFAYAYDAVGRPVERGGDAFAYNARGEVTNATIDSAAWSYAYDHIGNRTTASDSAGTTAYTANNVNQYTAVGADAPEYDLDGNLVVFGHCTNAWNAAGRLVSTTWAETNGLKRLRSEYDHRGRRIRRTQETSSDGGATWTAIESRTFVYDDWNLIYERSERPSEGPAELAFFWGPDLSGTLQGAGGVGGLVAVSIAGQVYFPGYDNNGNVIGYWDESGSLVAEYAYDAFGNTISSSGSMASVFPHRFSTKYYDAETDLYYYGYRYYSPSLGRWISRDPIDEDGGMNLVSFCNNNGVCFSDALGDCITVLLLGDSIAFGTPSKDKWGDFVGFSDFIKVTDSCSPFLRAGERGKRIDEINNQYSTIDKPCQDRIVVIAMMGMNDVLQNINKKTLGGRSTERIEQLIAGRAELMAKEWEKLIKQIATDFPLGNQTGGTDRKGLFIHLSIPTINVTGRTNPNYRGFATFRMNQTIWRANTEMSAKTTSVLKPKGWSLAPISTDGVIQHMILPTQEGDLSTIDDGVHFLESQMQLLGETISNTINGHSW